MKIMFICTGNICRSAMAHKLLEQKIRQQKREDIQVYSCGTDAIEGDISTREIKQVMKEEFNIDMSTHKATNIRNSGIEEMDLILCATKRHKFVASQMYPDLKDKIYTIKEYVDYDRKYHDPIDIKDPWGYDIETNRSCAMEIEECIDKLLAKV